MVDTLPVRLYNFLSKQIGSEDAVLTRRLLYSLMDYVCSTKYLAQMTSGSKGEGLDMEGSDLDIMIVLNKVNVYEIPPDDIPPDSFVMSTKATKPGFTHLETCGKINTILFGLCENFENQLCLSSRKLKTFFVLVHGMTSPPSNCISHGPCCSPDNLLTDLALTVRCRSWISMANPWATRNRIWPSAELVSEITDFGVLFVPIGCKGSPNEFIEWRISFSAAEKLLIYSFSHTQLFCYALLKMLMKEIIDKNENLKGLLCSYFLKTVVFWVSESLPTSEWRPDNLIVCFMKVFKRLLYFVEYSFLPHYFITENNLFENRFSLQQQSNLKSVLSRLFHMNIYCMKDSETISTFFYTIGENLNNSLAEEDRNLTERLNILIHTQHNDNMLMFMIQKSALGKLLTLQGRNELKSNSFLYSITLHDVLQTIGSKHIARTSGNKNHYKNGYKQFFPYLLCGRRTDAVSGWLTIASYFYKRKRYLITLDIIDYVLSKCTADIFDRYYISGDLYLQLTWLSAVEDDALQHINLNVDTVFRRNVARQQNSCFLSSIIIEELKQSKFFSNLPPEVYANFLQFLCFHHLSNHRSCKRSLKDLAAAVAKVGRIGGSWAMAKSKICLGISYKVVGNHDKAIRSFKDAFQRGYHGIGYFKDMLHRGDRC